MAIRTFGHATITLPELDEPGLYLSNVDSLDSSRGTVQDFVYGDADLRSLDLTDTQLVTGRLSGIRAKRLEFEAVNLHGVEISDSDLGTARWTESKLTRVHFRDCKLMGAALDGLVLDDVLFESCKLDFATFEKVRATGPVAFIGCVLTEATFADCDLSDTVFTDCTLRRAEFGTGRYRNTDLRENDLSAIRGVANLAKVRIDPGQQSDLAEALVNELNITIGDD
ncbi:MULTISPECIES: pentapeptide repeat-containing protein [unclassified Streptomyces]|uniref:pentapeptide repeat-containing protein n=1 Tax=unclassified Streptomyces TaxID=2593676 RepID=UPI00214BB8C8|nr:MULTISPECIES: pentapeptide repeat-containing protein [unclassified Streptomyces]UUU38746.1 pentapeptide repeat-containing protein [Streptomyces sp. NBC_00162]WRZ55659.1 pentapeptide repeat-containing protein [Streptomyces sp. NBC_01294]